jgi:hypothetical protein
MEPSMARQLAPLILSDEERTELKALAGRRKTAQALALRARIVLACAFLAAAAALISVCSIVVDADPLFIETLAIGAGWTLGLAMQVTAGVIGRIRS